MKKIGIRVINWGRTDDLSRTQQNEFKFLYHKYLKTLSQYTKKDILESRLLNQIAPGHYKCYLITLGDKFIGLIVLGGWPNSFSQHDTFIQEFFILPEYQRMGYGRQAAEWIVNRLSYNRDISMYILPENDLARNFWDDVMEDLGYVERFNEIGITATILEGFIFRYYVKY